MYLDKKKRKKKEEENSQTLRIQIPILHNLHAINISFVNSTVKRAIYIYMYVWQNDPTQQRTVIHIADPFNFFQLLSTDRNAIWVC